MLNKFESTTFSRQKLFYKNKPRRYGSRKWRDEIGPRKIPSPETWSTVSRVSVLTWTSLFTRDVLDFDILFSLPRTKVSWPVVLSRGLWYTLTNTDTHSQDEVRGYRRSHGWRSRHKEILWEHSTSISSNLPVTPSRKEVKGETSIGFTTDSPGVLGERLRLYKRDTQRCTTTGWFD